jgi:hypothetical protein
MHFERVATVACDEGGGASEGTRTDSVEVQTELLAATSSHSTPASLQLEHTASSSPVLP